MPTLYYLFFYLYKFSLRCYVWLRHTSALHCFARLLWWFLVCTHACSPAFVYVHWSAVPARKDRFPAVLCLVHANHRGVSEHWNVCDSDVFCETSYSVSSVPGLSFRPRVDVRLCSILKSSVMLPIVATLALSLATTWYLTTVSAATRTSPLSVFSSPSAADLIMCDIMIEPCNNSCMRISAEQTLQLNNANLFSRATFSDVNVVYEDAFRAHVHACSMHTRTCIAPDAHKNSACIMIAHKVARPQSRARIRRESMMHGTILSFLTSSPYTTALVG